MGVCSLNFSHISLCQSTFPSLPGTAETENKGKRQSPLRSGFRCRSFLWWTAFTLGQWPKATRNAKTHEAALKELPGSILHRVISWGVHTRPNKRNCKSGHPGIPQVVEKSILTAEGFRQKYIAGMPFRNPFCRLCYTKKETQTSLYPLEVWWSRSFEFPWNYLVKSTEVWNLVTSEILCIITHIL